MSWWDTLVNGARQVVDDATPIGLVDTSATGYDNIWGRAGQWINDRDGQTLADQNATRLQNIDSQNQQQAQETKSAIQDLINKYQQRTNPYSDPNNPMLAGEYNQINRGYDNALADERAQMAARGMGGQGQDASLQSNMAAARANAFTNAYGQNMQAGASWDENYQNHLAQLQQLAMQGGQQAFGNAQQVYNDFQNRADQQSANFNQMASGIAQTAARAGAAYATGGASLAMPGGGVGGVGAPSAYSVQSLNRLPGSGTTQTPTAQPVTQPTFRVSSLPPVSPSLGGYGNRLPGMRASGGY